jgi:signal transduction histidine kinase
VATDVHAYVPLPPLGLDAARAVLAMPRLPETAAGRVALVRPAADAGIALLLEAPAGSGRLLLARALHAIAERHDPLVALVGAPSGVAPGATVFVDVTALAPDAALALESMLDDRTVWVIAALDPGATLPASLAMRLDALVLSVPPLRERKAELPALAAAIVGSLARHAGRVEPELTPAALARLVAYDWPGDHAELETVLSRAWLLAGDGPVDVGHLTMGETSAAPIEPVATVPESRDGRLEFLLAELAHEVRNPLVTIKTFADHLPALLEDADLRERFAKLAAEGIARIDGLLDNLLTFARLGTPRAGAVDLGALLEDLLVEVGPELTERDVHVRRTGSVATTCGGDTDQLAFALRNLLAGVVREVPPRDELVLDASANGVVSLRFAAGRAASARLRNLVSPGRDTLGDPTLLPLSFTLARAVLERNGGALGIVPEPEGKTTLVVRLPVAATAG